MKFVSFLKDDEERLGLFYNDKIYDLKKSAKEIGLKLPSTMKKFLKKFDENYQISKLVLSSVQQNKISASLNSGEVKLLAPVPDPPSCRDGYAFRQHVATARRNRGVEMIPEFDQYPVFYFTNHNSILGEGDVYLEEDHFQKLDFELEVAIVIGKGGKNILSKDADKHIAGFMIMNDLSARVLQMEEMKLNLGPAKGKDFGTAVGPYLVTVDELEQYKIETAFGNKYDLRMTAFHNGKQVSDGNMKDMNWTFAELIERASYGVELYPGDIIGSGTVGTGCYLELNGTWALEAKASNKEFSPVWIKEGDEMVLEITGLGSLKNKFYKSANTFSLMAKNK
ncbi:MAG: fumarylacetoacetate hydrolase family protein [Ignavibacteriales bacterium]|nr:MAG: fumarylacetoacetate hydrolase family protein [Ignavibacteriales bacterium]